MRDFAYDIETYPNIFTFACRHIETGQVWQFEVSERRNQLPEFLQFMNALQTASYPGGGARMVGYNNCGFDYPVIHFIMDNPHMSEPWEHIYRHAMSIINANDNDRFKYMVWPRDRYVEQLDLFLIHHFNNVARSTSLKALQFAMRSESVEDLPFPVGVFLNVEQMDALHAYNLHDVDETAKFYRESLPSIAFREEVSAKYSRDFMNHNDTKIGKDFLIMKLEEANPGCCYYRTEFVSGRQIRQTLRPQIALRDVIFPYVSFERPEFQRILNYLKSRTITETKGVFKDLTATLDDFEFVFGTGGIHGSRENVIAEAGDGWQIIDIDVASYYPNLAIANRVYPEHLGETFCDIYLSLYEQRKATPKSDPVNGMLKLALNGVYGDSNNQYSPFYDPQYTMTITINGQLLLCMLAEQMLKASPYIQLLQINTDGMTVRCRDEAEPHVMALCKWWEGFTGLTLERADYSRMFIRDVNSYIAEKTDGSLKNKGAYVWKRGGGDGLQWHQDHSGTVIAAAATAALVDGSSIERYIATHPVDADFMMRAKIPRSSRLVLEVSDINRAPPASTSLPRIISRKVSVITAGVSYTGACMIIRPSASSWALA